MPKLDRDAAFRRLVEYLGPPEVAVGRFARDPPADGDPLEYYKDFRRWLGEEEVRLRIYRPVDTWMPEVAIPERYDAALDEVRRLRLELADLHEALHRRQSSPGVNWTDLLRATTTLSKRIEAHPLGQAILPEDMVPILGQLPTPSVWRVVLWDRPNPDDAFHQRLHEGKPFTSQAEVMKGGAVTPAERSVRRALNGQYRNDEYPTEADFGAAVQAWKGGMITLFKRCRSSVDYTSYSPLREVVLHEWAHVLQWETCEWDEVFDHAAEIEPASIHHGWYRQSSTSERWAAGLANLLHMDEHRFLREIADSPLCSVVLAHALTAGLDAVPAARRMKYHDDYAARAVTILGQATPAAQEVLLDALRRGRERWPAFLLVRLGWANRLRDLGPVRSLDLSHPVVDDAVLEHLRGMSVEWLRLAGGCITDAAGPVLASLNNLRRLDVRHNEGVTAALLYAIRNLPQLERVEVAFTSISRRDAKEWWERRPDIQLDL